MSRTTKRIIRPNVVTTPDNPIVQVKCDPQIDEINVDEVLNLVLARFEFVLGTSFDLQFVSLDASEVLALRRYVVTKVSEDIVTSQVNNYQTMTKNVSRRVCKPLGELMIFDPSAEVLLGNEDKEEKESDEEITDIQHMSTAQLQAVMKRKTGKGFKVGTPRKRMVNDLQKVLE